MCTVTYLPLPNKHFLLTHNRDEKNERAIASFPEYKTIENKKTIYPTDTKALGTWIALHENYAICLLNGGFQKHVSKPPYRHSRGHVILDFLRYKDISDFLYQYNIDQIEPFTLLVVEKKNRFLYQITLDNEKLHYEILNDKEAHIWSSTTLYSETQRQIRKKYFSRFVEENVFTKENIIKFHTNKYEQMPHEGIKINRENILSTVSLSFISVQDKEYFYYEDFKQKKNELFLFHGE
ncbi:MAG: NRDE family protein [Chitinophagaceae bacterium]